MKYSNYNFLISIQFFYIQLLSIQLLRFALCIKGEGTGKLNCNRIIFEARKPVFSDAFDYNLYFKTFIKYCNPNFLCHLIHLN